MSENPLFIDVSNIGSRCAECEGRCNETLAALVLMQQIGTSVYASSDDELIAEAPAELETTRIEWTKDIRALGCTLDGLALTGLIATVCGDEIIRDKANSVVNIHLED